MTPSKSPVRKSGKVKRVRMWAEVDPNGDLEFVRSSEASCWRAVILATGFGMDNAKRRGYTVRPVTVSYSLPQKKQKRKG